ncbi:hypothetical protein JCM10212_003317 [Sporobolomyces blumeae]
MLEKEYQPLTTEPEPVATTPEASPSRAETDEAPLRRRVVAPPASTVPVIGGISLLIALVAVLLLFWTDTVHLSHARTPYYTQTLMARPPPRTLRIGSFNVRYAPSGPLRPVKSLVELFTKPKDAKRTDANPWGEAKWEDRREKLVDQVLFHELDLVGYQEVLDHQYRDLEVLMGDEFGHVGVGRNDGKKAGEAVPIFYRRSRLELLATTHAWLSPTPRVPGSKGWDAGQPRMVTIARFRDVLSTKGEQVIVANTHWDDRGLVARTESAKLILDLVMGEAKQNGTTDAGVVPLVVLVGDLNSPAEEEGYQVLTGRRYLRESSTEAGPKAFRDSRHEIATRRSGLGGPGALSGPFGPLNTFTGFTPSDVPKIIDFVLVLDNAAFAPPAAPPASNPVEPVDSSFLDADDADEVLASISKPNEQVPLNQDEASNARSSRQTRWKVSRYGVVPNFYEDIGGRRPSGSDDALIVSDHRLVVVTMEEVVANA